MMSIYHGVHTIFLCKLCFRRSVLEVGIVIILVSIFGRLTLCCLYYCQMIAQMICQYSQAKDISFLELLIFSGESKYTVVSEWFPLALCQYFEHIFKKSNLPCLLLSEGLYCYFYCSALSSKLNCELLEDKSCVVTSC